MTKLIPQVLADIQDVSVDIPPGAIADFSPVISGVLQIIMIIAALICFIYLVWGGIEWMTSGGEKSAVAAARQRISAAFVGLLIVLAAWAIITLLEYLFGFSILKFEFPKLY